MTEENIRNALECFGNSIYRLSFYMLSNDQDAQDVVQETMVKYIEKNPVFDSPAQEKAWLLKVANNLCVDMLRFRKRVRFLDREDENRLAQMVATSEVDNDDEKLIELLFSLKEKIRNVIYGGHYLVLTDESENRYRIELKTSDGTIGELLTYEAGQYDEVDLSGEPID